MSPHRSAIFLQHSRSAAVISASGTTHAITGSAENHTAREKTATLINSFNITSLSTANSKTQQAGKGFIRLTGSHRNYFAIGGFEPSTTTDSILLETREKALHGHS